MNRRRFFALAVAAAITPTAARSEPAADMPLVSFGVITDVQYADADPQGERHYRASLPKLQAAAADLAREKLAFSLHLGDLIDHDFASFAAILPGFQALGHPARQLLGNHDVAVPDADKGRVRATLDMPQDYYSFSASGVRFVMLDTNDLSTYKHPQDSAAQRAAKAALAQLATTSANNAKAWNSGVTPAQLDWLDKELAAADLAREPVIMCGHHSLLPEDGHQIRNNREILAVIDRHQCVRAYLCGHNHGGNEVIVKGVPYITFKSLVNKPEVTAYAVLRLFKNRLVIEGRGREKSRVIPLPG